MMKIAMQANALPILLVHKNAGLRIRYSSEAAISQELRKERVVIGRHQLNCMTRSVSDKMRIFMDKKLLTTNETGGLTDSSGIAPRRFPCACGANISRD